MKFRISKHVLARGISAVQNAVGSPISNPIVENIFLSCKEGQAEFIATNLKLTTRCIGEADIEEEGQVVLPRKYIISMVRDLGDGDVEFKTEEQTIHIAQGEFKAKLSGQPADQFPPFSTLDDGFTFEMDIALLKTIVRRSIIAATDEKSRFELDGVFFDFKDQSINFVSTDGRRLACHSYSNESLSGADISAMTPMKTLQELIDSLPNEGTVKTMIQETKIQFECGDTTLVSNLLKNNFPQYDRIIPKDCKYKAYVKRDDLLTAIRRISNLTDSNAPQLTMDISKDTIELHGSYSEIGGESHDKIKAEYGGDPISGTYNYRFLIDFLRVIDDETVEIQIWEEGRPVLFLEKDKPDYLYEVMPMKRPETDGDE